MKYLVANNPFFRGLGVGLAVLTESATIAAVVKQSRVAGQKRENEKQWSLAINSNKLSDL